MAIVGIIILAIVIAAILKFRNYVNTQGNPALKTAMKIGDFFIWIRFIGFIILFLFLVAIFTTAKLSK